MNVLQAALHIIQTVFAFSAFVELAGNGNSIEFGWKEVLGIFKSQAHLSKSAWSPVLRTIEHQALQIFTSQVADFMFTDHPSDGIDNITFTASIWTNNTCNSLVKIDNCLVRKALEPLDF
jgi:hypothetical protein